MDTCWSCNEKKQPKYCKSVPQMGNRWIKEKRKTKRNNEENFDTRRQDNGYLHP